MNFELIQASEEHKSVIENLMQFYIYDFSEYINCDVEEDGLFGAYPDLEKYWREENHGFPYIIKIGQRYASFVLVRFIEASNKPAQLFWNKIISEYTKGEFKERVKNERRIQDFEN
jgi:predicted acetyltransferase